MTRSSSITDLEVISLPDDAEVGETTGERLRDPLIGRVLARRYRVDELIASGGMGAVYRGVHLNMRKRVAIKVLHPRLENFPHLVARFEREAIAGANIHHPNVAAATDFAELEDGSYFLVMEYLEGTTLQDVLFRG